MSTFTIYLAALLIGVIAGLRALTALAAVSWAAYAGALHVQGTPLAFLAFWVTPWVLTVLAVAELVNDQLPRTPSRKKPAPFAARIVSGAVSGAAIAITGGSWLVGLVLGGIGAIIGTLGGASVRARLARAFHRDRPAAVLEDGIAIVGAAFAVAVLS